MSDDSPNIDLECFQDTDRSELFPTVRAMHPPRILLLYGSVRKRSFSRLATQEAARILEALGCETRPGAIAQSEEFARLCPASATCMYIQI